jgi:hypothetical protein
MMATVRYPAPVGDGSGSRAQAIAARMRGANPARKETTMLIQRMIRGWTLSVGLLGFAMLTVIALVTMPSAHAQSLTSGISPPPAPSTPSCGLGDEDYPSCPVSADDERIAKGFEIAPVGLDLTGLDPRKVGIGSYWMNSAGNCSGCHASKTLGNGGKGGQYTLDGNPQQLPTSVPGGTYAYASVINPYNPPAIINADGYLGGGSNFGNPNCDSAGGGGCGSEVIARNLTPDFTTGSPLPEGNTLDRFKRTLRTGHDFQQVHLNCAPLGAGSPPACLSAPSDGTKLQVMPWPALSGATDYDLESIYEYLKSIPCISNAGSAYPQIIHVCPADPLSNHHKYVFVNGEAHQAD